ncbi:MAG: hypothetical protein MI867_22490, partial [Pseudomonadales bacterium]|nr:hypothetical protein [Pseudomonadales bacterium]
VAARVDVMVVRLEHGTKQVRAIAEVILQGTDVALPRCTADLAHRNVVDAAFCEQSARGLDELRSRVSWVARASARAGRSRGARS